MTVLSPFEKLSTNIYTKLTQQKASYDGFGKTTVIASRPYPTRRTAIWASQISPKGIKHPYICTPCVDICTNRHTVITVIFSIISCADLWKTLLLETQGF